MNKYAIILIIFIVILSGCSQGTDNKAVNTSNLHQSTPPAVEPSIPVDSVLEAPLAEELPEPELDLLLENEIPQNYHMTSNYYVKPNDEDGNKKVVLLTFDDGPKDEVMLTELLDILDKHDAKAIFFVNGYRVKQKPELLKLIYDRGQMIGNHSWDHINLKKETRESIRQQIGDVQELVKEIIGEAPLFFRPPNGAGNEDVYAEVKEEGMLYMTWSNGSLDWADNVKNPQGVIDSVMEQLMPGSNILMHELSWTVEALDPLLTKIKEQGYSFLHPLALELEAR